jgi:hypothetical protein
MGNYTPETKPSCRTPLWTVLLRAARFGPMARLLDVWRSLQTLVIDQVSGMIWPKNDELFFRPTLFSQLYSWNKKTKQSYTLECFVASSPILAHGEASGRLEKFANFGHRSGFRHDMRCLSAYDKTKNWTNGVELVAKTFLLKCVYVISSFFW